MEAFCKNEQAAFSKEEAIQKVLKLVNAKQYGWEDKDYVNLIKRQKQENIYPQPELVYLNPQFNEDVSACKLCYKMEIVSVQPFEHYIFYINAVSGTIEYKINQMHNCFGGDNHVDNQNLQQKTTAPDQLTTNNATYKRIFCEEGRGLTNYYGTVDITTEFNEATGEYVLRDYCNDSDGIEVYTCGNTTTHPQTDITDLDNVWTDENQKTGVEAFWCARKVYDYFLNEHNRNSYDEQGAVIEIWVNYGNALVALAFFPFIHFGDGDGISYGPKTCLDVLGHEYTHLIIKDAISLGYTNESGALNQSFADIFGTVIEFLYDPNPADRDWNLGEDAHLTGTGFRNMSNPNDKNDPDTYFGNYWYTGDDDQGGVHTNNGIQNYWFYLLTEGGSGINDNGFNYQVQGIGLTNAAKIAYRNMTVYLSSNSEYEDAVQGAMQAAEDLYGVGSNEVQQTINAWKAVGLANDLETPETTDVYPGDLNHDGIVDNQDFSIKELYLYQSSNVRESEHQNIDWYAHPSVDTGVHQFNGKDVKHHDCNGDGTIDEQDHQAIDANMGETWQEPDNPLPPPESEYQVRLYPVNEVDPNFMRMNVALENVAGGDLELHSGHFTIQYGDTADNIISAIFNFNTFSWLGVPNLNLSTLVEANSTEEKIEVGFTRTDGENGAGSGIIGELTLLLSGNANARLASDAFCLLNFEVNKIGMHDNHANAQLLKNQLLKINLCEGTCETNWYLNDESQFQNLYTSINLIETDGYLIIGEEQQVNYQSNRVCLRPGFRVKAGASFKAGYGSCD